MWIPPPPLLTHLHRESRGTSLERLFFQRLTGCYLHEGLCYNAGHGSTEGGNSHSHALLFRASSFSSLWGSTTGPWGRAWSQDRCEKVPSLTWLRHYGYRRKRWENYAFSKAQQFHGNKKKPKQLRIQILLLLFHWSALRLTGNNKWLHKTFQIHRGNSEIMSCPKISNLKSHSWGNNIFQGKLKQVYGRSEGPSGKPGQKSKLMQTGLVQFHLEI